MMNWNGGSTKRQKERPSIGLAKKSTTLRKSSAKQTRLLCRDEATSLKVTSATSMPFTITL